MFKGGKGPPPSITNHSSLQGGIKRLTGKISKYSVFPEAILCWAITSNGRGLDIACMLCLKPY